MGDDPALAYFATTNLGICYDKMGQLDAAKKEFGEALAIAQATERPLRDKARLMREQETPPCLLLSRPWPLVHFYSAVCQANSSQMSRRPDMWWV